VAGEFLPGSGLEAALLARRDAGAKSLDDLMRPDGNSIAPALERAKFERRTSGVSFIAATDTQ